MAKIDPLIPIEFKIEGGFVDHKNDRGGATNLGVTLETWKSQGYDKDGDGDIDKDDLLLLNRNDVVGLLQIRFDMCKANLINNQSIANILVDWVWNSGIWGIKMTQLAIGVIADGKVGKNTIDAINNGNQAEIHSKIWNARKMWFKHIVEKDSTQKVFYNGWMNRLSNFKYSVK